MEKRELPCWAALTIIGGLLLLAVFMWQLPKSSSEWAAWVQAFGSIAALGGAYWLGREQARFADNLEIEKKRRAILSIGDVARERACLIRSLLPSDEGELAFEHIFPVQAKLMTEYHSSISDGIVSAIKNIPIHEVGSTKAIIALQDLEVQFGFLDKDISNFIKGPMRLEVFADLFSCLEPGSNEYIEAEVSLKNLLLSYIYRRIEYINEAHAALLSNI